MSSKNRKFFTPAPASAVVAPEPTPVAVSASGPTAETVMVQVMSHAADLPLPDYATAGAAGVDLLAAIDKDLALMAGSRVLVPTGLRLALPAGMEAQIRPRSGLALNYGLTVLNAPGTIDPDYRGEVKVLLVNLGGALHVIRRGDRIAQMVFSRFCTANLAKVDTLSATERGEGGFGSTGVS